MKEEMIRMAKFMFKEIMVILLMIGAWIALGAILINWNLPGFAVAIIELVMLLGIPSALILTIENLKY